MMVAMVMAFTSAAGSGFGFHGVLAAFRSFECLHTTMQTQPLRIDYTEFSFLGRPVIHA